MLMLGICIGGWLRKLGCNAGGISVCVAADTVAGTCLSFGDGGTSRYGDLGVLGGLRGSSAVCDDP